MRDHTAWAGRWFRGTSTMLGQIRTLFLGFLILWPVFGLWGIDTHEARLEIVLALAAAFAIEIWLYWGYRRQRFPAWSWIFEGLCVLLVAGASDFGATVGLCFMWVNFRALYGRMREKFLGAAVLVAIMTTGIAVYHTSPTNTISLLFTALLSLSVNHVLAKGSSARDRAAARESAVASAGAGLAASSTRAEAMDITLGAALAMDHEVRAALLCTFAGPALHVVAAAGTVGSEAVGWVTELERLPATARDALQPGGYVVIGDGSAAALAETLRMHTHKVVALAPLVANEKAFGMLVLGLTRRPADDLSAAVTTLAGEAALTLDQLLIQSRLSIVVDHLPDALLLAAETGIIRFVNPGAEAMLGRSGDDLIDQTIWSLVHPDDLDAILEPDPTQLGTGVRPCRIRGAADSAWIDVEVMLEYASEHDGTRSIVFTARDVSERQRLELELRHAQKLESVGRLASGIAHEINTPIQFIGDNARFLESSFVDLGRLYAAYHELTAKPLAPEGLAEAMSRVHSLADEIDMEFIMEEVPMAIAQMLEGISRVANIVRAMKSFGHPGNEDKAQADLNEAIRNTIVVANNEIKYVADVETELGDLPLVHCHLGDINQVVLNLVVNAAHAIAAAGRGHGIIRVSTQLDGDYAVINVSDTGTGVPAEIADKLFDPFFTTKEVGTGTGQGLALVRTLVTDRHGGTIDFTSEMGVGTTFTVRLPVAANDRQDAAAELAEVPS